MMVSVEDGQLSPVHKKYDPVTFDVLRVNLEELARQITWNDLHIFKKITVTELQSCAWTKKSKWEETPAIAEFTQSFNSISYLTCREILAGHTAEHRAQLITYFIKLAKKLYHLNNLHSTWAIISALTTQPVFRLNQTWQHYMDSTSMPCVPHIGIYLTDLIFLHDMLKKAQTNRRSIQENINKVLRQICSFQDSCYESTYLPHIQSFLLDAVLPLSMVPSAEKLFYQLSLRLEPEKPPQRKDSNEIKNGVRRSSLPLQAIRSLTSAAKFSPNTVSLKSPKKKEIAGRHFVSRPFNDRSIQKCAFNIDNASYTSPTRSRWYTLDNAEDEERDIDESSTFTQRSTNSSRLSDLTRRLKSLDIYEAASPAWLDCFLISHQKVHVQRRKLRKRNTFSMTPELLRRSKTPTMRIEQCSLIGDETCEEPEVVGIFTRTQLRGQNAKSKLIHIQQTCYLELRGRTLLEYERRLVPLHVTEDRELFQQRAKRQIHLNEGGWHIHRSCESRPGFQLEHDGTGRAIQYTCRSWPTANHWIQLINDAIHSDDDAQWTENEVYRCSNGMEATRL
ncbi:Ras-GEF domain-containing protein [Aphelenchoides bicaudatus]|nr:Ras-GEF domain-containing protein [Aphelenchoides bicaudatus]